LDVQVLDLSIQVSDFSVLVADGISLHDELLLAVVIKDKQVLVLLDFVFALVIQ
jgi:hypothetical protein